MPRILCIWLPDWPVQRLVQTCPQLAAAPLVLYHAVHGGLRVAVCNKLARRAGVQPAMPLAEAQALLRRERRANGSKRRTSQQKQKKPEPQPEVDGSPKLNLQEHDPVADREALLELARRCERFSPVVGLEEDARPSSLLADVTGVARLFGGEKALALEARRELAALGLQPHLAIADSIGAAWAVSHYEPVAGSEPVLVPSGESGTLLAALPVAALRLPAATLGVLARLGIDRIGQLERLPRHSLRSRFGPQLLLRLDQATGRAAEVFAALPPRPEFSAHWLLEHATSQRAVLEFVLSGLIERLAVQLAAQGYGALEFQCQLDGERRSLTSFTVGLFRPSAASDHLLQLARMHLDRTRLKDDVACVRVQVVRSAPLALRQRTLFPDATLAQESRQLALLVDRLVGRLGRHAVVRPSLRGEAQPEMAWRSVPLVGEAPRRRSSARPADKLGFGPLDRPLFLLARAEPLREVETRRDGSPRAFRRGEQQYQVARSWGPERIETGWWRKRGVRRDYYRVETPDGRRFWIFRRLRDGNWFWQGEFV